MALMLNWYPQGWNIYDVSLDALWKWQWDGMKAAVYLFGFEDICPGIQCYVLTKQYLFLEI